MKKPTQFYWLSWYQKTEDHRPITYPPNDNVIGWWCTGYRDSDDASMLVALVTANSHEHAEEVIKQDWPEALEWRFNNQILSTKLGDRFPLSDWMKSRISKL